MEAGIIQILFIGFHTCYTMKQLLILAILVLSLVVYAQEVKLGIYDIKGIDEKNAAYEGKCIVSKHCQVYGMFFDFGETKEIGVGVLKEGQLLVVFQTLCGGEYGREVITLKEGVLDTADWTLFNREAVGKETFTFKEVAGECKCNCESCAKQEPPEIKLGMYDIKGVDSANEAYEGKCGLMKFCKIYPIFFDYGETGKEIGVGILKEGKLLVVFQTLCGTDYGHEVITVKDGVLESAEWKLYNKTSFGTETFAFKGCPEGCKCEKCDKAEKTECCPKN